MTVKCLTQEQKDSIVFLYSAHQMEQIHIATRVGTSARTVNRVLNERGLLTAVPQIKADAYNVMQVLKKHGIQASELDKILTSAKPDMPALVEQYLAAASEEELGRLFWMATKAKVKDEMVQELYAQENMTSGWSHLETVDAALPF